MAFLGRTLAPTANSDHAIDGPAERALAGQRALVLVVGTDS